MAALTPSQHGRPVVAPRLIDVETILMLCERDIVRFVRERAQLYGSLARTVVWLFVLGYSQAVFIAAICLGIVANAESMLVTLLIKRLRTDIHSVFRLTRADGDRGA